MSKVMFSTDMDMENKSLLSLKVPKKHRTPHTIIFKKIKIMGSELVFPLFLIMRAYTCVVFTLRGHLTHYNLT